MTDLFASVPDRCPECSDPLDVQVDLTESEIAGTAGTLSLYCTGCGWERTEEA